VAERGLPVVFFVCMTDRIVGCSGDLWSEFREFNRACRTRRKARFTPGDSKDALEDMELRSNFRFNYIVRWLSGKDPVTGITDTGSPMRNDHFGELAQEFRLPKAKYNQIVQAMYGESPGNNGPWPPLRDGVRGGQKLDSKFGFSHISESGRSFYGQGGRIFTPMSRCWKCRFVFHYKMYRPGTAGAGSDGVDPENPCDTSWVANDPFTCAEDLVHFRCWTKHGGVKPDTPDQDLIFKPFPNI
jgi:hypothetical protein